MLRYYLVKLCPKLETLEKKDAEKESRVVASFPSFYIYNHTFLLAFCYLNARLSPIKNFSLKSTQKVLLILANFLAYLDHYRRYYLEFTGLVSCLPKVPKNQDLLYPFAFLFSEEAPTSSVKLFQKLLASIFNCNVRPVLVGNHRSSCRTMAQADNICEPNF